VLQERLALRAIADKMCMYVTSSGSPSNSCVSLAEEQCCGKSVKLGHAARHSCPATALHGDCGIDQSS
jgi:hypothetical protein